MWSTEPGYRRDDRRTAVFVGVLVVVALFIVSSTAFVLWRSRIDAYQRADAAAVAILQVIAKDIEHTIGSHDTSLRWAINALSTPGFTEASEPIRRQMLFAGNVNTSLLGGDMIADDTGRVLYDSGAAIPRVANVANRPDFQALRDHPNLSMVLSRPTQTAASGGLSIVLTRRHNASDGRFAGIVYSTIPLSVLNGLIHTVTEGSGDVVTLLNDDGILVARDPADAAAIGRDMSALPGWQEMLRSPGGSFDAESPVDGVGRHKRFARVGEWPLVLMAGTSLRHIYAGWWKEALAIGGITTATILLLLGLARALSLELARRRGAEMIAREGAEQFRILAENVTDIIVRLDLNGVRSYVSPSVREVLGYTPEEMLAGPTWTTFVHPEDRPAVEEALMALRAGSEQITIVYRCRKKSGDEVRLEAHIRLISGSVTGKPREMIAVAHDVTSRYASEQELKRLATTDGLTSVANRRVFDEILDKEWRRAMRSEERIALLMLDADYFKLYNDRYGHQAGDDVLRIVASCIVSNVRRPGDLVARYGGEEFAVLLPGTDMPGAVMLGEGIRLAIEQRAVPHDDSPLKHVTVSIGVACSLVMTGDDPRSLIQHADLALYEAKSAGRNRVVPADRAMTVHAG